MPELRGEISSRRVWLDGKELRPGRSQKLYNHSSDGFMWGYGGSGPAQLALAVLTELIGEERALSCYQDFKWNFIAGLPQANFEVEIPELWTRF